MQAVRRLLALGGATVVALTVAGAAPSASDSPVQLLVATRPASLGGGVGIELFSDPEAAAPGRLTFYAPAGYGLDTSVAPGTPIGSISALYSTKTIPFDVAYGPLKTGDPASLPSDPAAQACAPGAHAAVWVATFKAAKRSTTLRFYVDPTTGSETALGAFRLIACYASPDVPVDQGGAPGGLRFEDVYLDVGKKAGSVFTVPASGTFTWRVLITPYVKGTGTLDGNATFEARTRVLIPHVLTVHARYRAKSKTVLVTGRLSALGSPRAGVKVSVVGGSVKSQFLIFWGSAHTRSDGSYSFAKHVRLQRRARRLEIFTFLNPVPGPCIDPTTAPGGCVDENLSPPLNLTVYVTIPRLRKH